MKIKLHNSIRFKILFFYVMLSLITLSFVTSIIFENQADLISENTKLESERQLGQIIDSIKKFSEESKKGSLLKPANSREGLNQVLKLLSIQARDYIIFSEKGEIQHKSSGRITPPPEYVKDGLRSLTAMTFSGKEYYLCIDENRQVMYCYIPLSEFELGSSILLLEKEIRGMNDSLRHLYSQAVYVILIVFFFHIIFALILFRMIIKPVNLLTHGARSLTDGRLNTRISLPGRNDEFASLAAAFNQMAESIHGNIETLTGEIDNAMESVEKSARMSTRDELTGLYSRRYFLERLEEEIKRNASGNSATGLMLMGVDGLSGITDIYGRQTGNIILSETAKKISRSSPENAVTARYGEEIFALMLPGTSDQAMKAAAERIAGIIPEIPVITPDREFNVTVSIGLIYTASPAGKSETACADLIKKAEEALRRALSNGPNSIEFIQ